MSIYRRVSIRCDANDCNEESAHAETAQTARKKATNDGWSCAHPYGQDYCSKHAAELGTGHEYWELIKEAARRRQDQA